MFEMLAFQSPADVYVKRYDKCCHGQSHGCWYLFLLPPLKSTTTSTATTTTATAAACDDEDDGNCDCCCYFFFQNDDDVDHDDDHSREDPTCPAFFCISGPRSHEILEEPLNLPRLQGQGLVSLVSLVFRVRIIEGIGSVKKCAARAKETHPDCPKGFEVGALPTQNGEPPIASRHDFSFAAGLLNDIRNGCSANPTPRQERPVPAFHRT